MAPLSTPKPVTVSALKSARQGRGWSQSVAAVEFAKVAVRLNVSVPESDSIKTALSRWENGKRAPDDENLRVLRSLYGLTDTELGIGAEPSTPDAVRELALRLNRSGRVDAHVIALLDDQTHQLRLQDRRFGAAVLLDQMGAHVANVSTILAYTASPLRRKAIARVLADAAALAGWQALDAAAATRAWEHFDTARVAGAESGDSGLLAHALGEQCYALVETGNIAEAHELATHAAALPKLPPHLRAWLAAVSGEINAVAGNASAALSDFDRAHALLPTTADESLPFISLDDTHLSRWRGSAQAKLGQAEAIDTLTATVQRLDASFVRARAGLETDLATAYAAIGERDKARTHIRAATNLAREIGSQRLLNRLRLIHLPGGQHSQ